MISERTLTTIVHPCTFLQLLLSQTMSKIAAKPTEALWKAIRVIQNTDVGVHEHNFQRIMRACLHRPNDAKWVDHRCGNLPLHLMLKLLSIIYETFYNERKLIVLGYESVKVIVEAYPLALVTRCADGWYPLRYAVSLRDDFWRYLFERSLQLTLANDLGVRAILSSEECAISNDCSDKINPFLVQHENGRTLLHELIKSGLYLRARQILAVEPQCVTIKCKNYRRTALQYAVFDIMYTFNYRGNFCCEQLAFVRDLIYAYSRASKHNETKECNPLYAAILSGNSWDSEAIRLFLDYGVEAGLRSIRIARLGPFTVFH